MLGEGKKTRIDEAEGIYTWSEICAYIFAVVMGEMTLPTDLENTREIMMDSSVAHSFF